MFYYLGDELNLKKSIRSLFVYILLLITLSQANHQFFSSSVAYLEGESAPAPNVETTTEVYAGGDVVITTTIDKDTGVKTITSTYPGGSTTSVEDPRTGTSTTEVTVQYTDPATGQIASATVGSTTQTYTDPSTGAQVTSTSSTFIDPSTGKITSGESTSSVTTSSTGESVWSYTSTYTNPITGDTSSVQSTAVTSKDPVTGGTITKQESSSEDVDLQTGVRTSSTNSLTITSYVDPETGAAITKQESSYDKTDPLTGERKNFLTESSYQAVQNFDGSVTSNTVSSYPDPATGNLVTTNYESTYSPDAGTTVSTSTYTDSEGIVHTSHSELKYNPATGESVSTYLYTDPETGEEKLSRSSTKLNEDGTYTSYYTYLDPQTGQEQTNPYYGVYGGADTIVGTTYYYFDPETGITYPFTYDGAPPPGTYIYTNPDGSKYLYTDTSKEISSLAGSYGSAYALAVDASIPVGDAEYKLIKENNLVEKVSDNIPVETELVGEPVILFDEYVKKVKEEQGDGLSEEELKLVALEYENFEERIKQGEGSNLPDLSPETYLEYQELYDKYKIPEELRTVSSTDDFEKEAKLKQEFFTRRDEIFSKELNSEEKASELSKLEREFAGKYSTEIGVPSSSLRSLPERGEIDFTSFDPNTISTLSPSTIDSIIEKEFTPQFQRLLDANIPPTHPQWKELESQAISRRESLLNEQESVILNEILLGCQGSFGGAGGACSNKIEIVDEILSSCEYGSDAGSACHEAAQVVAYQLGCESSSDKNSCIGEAKKIAEEVKNPVKDETAKDAWIYSVDLIPEKQAAEESYLDLRACGSSSECESRYEERLNANLLDIHEEWRIAYDSLTPEQREFADQEKEKRRVDFSQSIEAEIGSVRTELPESERPVLDELHVQIEKTEEGKLPLMKEFLAEAKEAGHDTVLLEFYINQFEQSLDGSKDQAAHKDFLGAVGSMEQSEKYFDLYLGEAKELYQSDSSGKTYVAPKNPLSVR